MWTTLFARLLLLLALGAPVLAPFASDLPSEVLRGADAIEALKYIDVVLSQLRKHLRDLSTVYGAHFVHDEDGYVLGNQQLFLAMTAATTRYEPLGGHIQTIGRALADLQSVSPNVDRLGKHCRLGEKEAQWLAELASEFDKLDHQASLMFTVEKNLMKSCVDAAHNLQHHLLPVYRDALETLRTELPKLKLVLTLELQTILEDRTKTCESYIHYSLCRWYEATALIALRKRQRAVEKIFALHDKIDVLVRTPDKQIDSHFALAFAQSVLDERYRLIASIDDESGTTTFDKEAVSNHFMALVEARPASKHDEL